MVEAMTIEYDECIYNKFVYTFCRPVPYQFYFHIFFFTISLILFYYAALLLLSHWMRCSNKCANHHVM